MIDQSYAKTPEKINNMFKNSNQVHQLCKKLFEDTPINFFSLGRVFDDGTIFDLSSSSDWPTFFYENDFEKEVISARLRPGINPIRKNSNNTVLRTDEISEKDFDITNKIDFVKQGDGFFDMFIFAVSKKDFDKGGRFYITHQDKLLKFIAFFNKAAKDMIAEAENNKIHIPGYECPINKLNRCFHKEMSEDGNDLGLSAQEFLVLILYAGGSSAQQIADMLYKSVKTIETYVARIKEKTGYKDRRSFNMLVYERGWNDLLGFFLPYMETDSVH